ncbi:alpha/beta hydrolase, partial [Streptomyces tateyamensis]
VAMVRDGTEQFAGPLHDRYDIVGFDPRGTGDSSPVRCLTDRQRDAADQQDDPADPQARLAFREQQAREYAQACEANAGKLLPFVGTRNTARDMDRLRQALGQEKL